MIAEEVGARVLRGSRLDPALDGEFTGPFYWPRTAIDEVVLPVQHEALADFARGERGLSVEGAIASIPGRVTRVAIEGVIHHHIVANGKPFFRNRVAPKKSTGHTVQAGISW